MKKPEAILDMWTRHGIRILYVQEVYATPKRLHVNVFAVVGGQIVRVNAILKNAGISGVTSKGHLLIPRRRDREDVNQAPLVVGELIRAVCSQVYFKMQLMPL